ncbi:MAG: menaquinone biosynthesis protein [Peptococcaceae bacterium]|nr:menaquinone biosynthesis protein [Peptococcaceae bacterium]
MVKVRLGQVDYLNCLPIYYPIETDRVPIKATLVKGVPTRLNRLFFAGELDITPVSSIEYARYPGNCLILPDMSISSDGRVGSISLFSRVPVAELDGKKVCLPDTSATSVALLKVLFQHYYQIEVAFETTPDDLDLMMSKADAGLLIGDKALAANYQVKATGRPLFVTDLGMVWKDFTGTPMVFALWVIRREFAEEHPRETEEIAHAFLQAKKIGNSKLETLIDVAHRKNRLPREVLEDYFALIKHDFDERYRRGLLSFYDYAYKTGLIEERMQLDVWGE